MVGKEKVGPIFFARKMYREILQDLWCKRNISDVRCSHIAVPVRIRSRAKFDEKQKAGSYARKIKRVRVFFTFFTFAVYKRSTTTNSHICSSRREECISERSRYE